MIRLLTADDAASLQRLRLLGLQTDPDSFISTLEYEKEYPVSHFENRISHATQSDMFGFLGYFKNENLIGYLQLYRESLPKVRHLVKLYELYIDPQYRHRGLASNLLRHSINVCKATGGVEQIHLRVVATNTPAIHLYEKHGFSCYAVKKNGIKSDAREYLDELLMVRFCL